MKTPASAYLFLAIGMVVISQSGNIVRLADAHPVAIAGWRLLLACIVLVPIAGPKFYELRSLAGRELMLLVLSGITLAVHFFTWIAAVQNTTVASAAIFFSVNPVFVSVASYLLYGERPTAKLFMSILLGLAGVVVLGHGDLKIDSAHLAGDAWAVACALLFTVYFMLGKRFRRLLSTTVYVAVVYGVAAATSFGVMIASGMALFSYSGKSWLAFALLAAGPTLMGHTSFNHALRYLRAGWLSALTLSEPLLAAIVAWWAWGEAVTASTAAGYVLVGASVLVLVTERRMEPE